MTHAGLLGAAARYSDLEGSEPRQSTGPRSVALALGPHAPEFLLGHVPFHLVHQVGHEDDTGFVAGRPMFPGRAPSTSVTFDQRQAGGSGSGRRPLPDFTDDAERPIEPPCRFCEVDLVLASLNPA